MRILVDKQKIEKIISKICRLHKRTDYFCNESSARISAIDGNITIGNYVDGIYYQETITTTHSYEDSATVLGVNPFKLKDALTYCVKGIVELATEEGSLLVAQDNVNARIELTDNEYLKGYGITSPSLGEIPSEELYSIYKKVFRYILKDDSIKNLACIAIIGTRMACLNGYSVGDVCIANTPLAKLYKGKNIHIHRSHAKIVLKLLKGIKAIISVSRDETHIQYRSTDGSVSILVPYSEGEVVEYERFFTCIDASQDTIKINKEAFIKTLARLKVLVTKEDRSLYLDVGDNKITMYRRSDNISVELVASCNPTNKVKTTAVPLLVMLDIAQAFSESEYIYITTTTQDSVIGVRGNKDSHQHRAIIMPMIISLNE